MEEKEKKLFKALCNFQAKEFDEALLAYATPSVLGQLFFNRMEGAAYGVLQRNGLTERVSREFRNSLHSAYEQNKRRNKQYLHCVDAVAEVLEQWEGSGAMVKGAVLCAVYPEGYRRANDIDLLILPRDVTEVGRHLTARGFRQGHLRNGRFVPANRREIIESKMTRGEVVPYIKEMDLPEMEYLEVDLNFSLDYKNSDETAVKAMLERVTHDRTGGRRIPTLCKEDFLIHLCGHLYKEAATLPWVEMKRDMGLYKYADLYLLLGRMSPKEITELFERAAELEMKKICAYGILQTAVFFDGIPEEALEKAREALQDDELFLHRVISPGEVARYSYHTKDIEKRFFMKNRMKDLRKETENEKT